MISFAYGTPQVPLYYFYLPTPSPCLPPALEETSLHQDSHLKNAEKNTQEPILP